MSRVPSQPALSRPIDLAERRPESSPAPAVPVPFCAEALVTRAQRGDIAAWSRLYQEYFETVFRHVCYLTGDPALSEDLVQDAFARAMTSIGRYDGRATFVSWLRGIALNVVRMHWRRAKTTDRVEGDLQRMQELSRPDRSIDGQHLQDQRMRALYDVLQTLPVTLREAFVVRELEGLSTQDAAQQLGISPGNVAVRATRARKKIRTALQRRGWLGEGATA